MRKPVHNVKGLHPKVAPIGSEEQGSRDPLWAVTPSIPDAERKLAVAVLARAFDDLHVKDGAFFKDVYMNRRNRNSAILFLTSGPERHEWYLSRCYWARCAGYCPDKMRTKAIAICKQNNLHIVPINDDVDGPNPEGAEVTIATPMIKYQREDKYNGEDTYNELLSFLNTPKTRREIDAELNVTRAELNALLDKGKRTGTITRVGEASPATYVSTVPSFE